MRSLIDGDICCYRVGFASKNDPLDINLLRIDVMIREILEETRSTYYDIYLSGDNNFRYKVNPEYKANRKDSEKPPFLQELREYLVTEWKAQVTEGIEADDALGIAQTFSPDTSVICSIDKDLKQIPGNHYNFVKKEWDSVDPWKGLKFFYEQLLIGDTADNIFGIRGIGPKKAASALSWCETEQELFETVRDMYNDDERLLMNGRCLKIRQHDDEGLWRFPINESEVETETNSVSLQVAP